MTSASAGFGRDERGEATLGGTRIRTLLDEARALEPTFGTPAYLYDLSAIFERTRQLEEALAGTAHLVAYAVKANSAGTIVRTIARAGAGIDAVSGGELLLARRAGVPPDKIVLSGVAKRDDEIDLALGEGILALQAESVTELGRIADRARASGKRARVSFRVNPSVEIDSHAHIATGHDKAKFGIARSDLGDAFSLVTSRADALELVGISTHVGSMLKRTAPYLSSARVVCEVGKAAEALGHRLTYLDFGGGFGIDYGEGQAETPAEFARHALSLLRSEGLGEKMLVVEPGRSLVGAYGVVVSRVVQSKVSGDRRWLMLDAGMNDLIRPALYQARHRIEALSAPPGPPSFRVVGPVCESTDDFGDFDIGSEPDFVVIRDAGAYSFSMASEYNARPLPAEVFVDGGRVVSVAKSPGVDDWIDRRLRA